MRCIHPSGLGPALGAVLLGIGLALPLRADARPAATVTQTVRWVRQGDLFPEGNFWIGYSSLRVGGARWNVRSSFSWLSWDPETPDIGFPGDSGFSALHLTAGHRLWAYPSDGGSSSTTGWVRIRGKLPLQETPSALGTGEPDWGGSLLVTSRFDRLLLIAEGGYASLGEPANVAYQGLVTGIFTVRYDSRALPFAPFASLVTSSPQLEDDPAYLEVSAGASLTMGRRHHATLSVSRGLTDVSPIAGVAIALSRRL